MLLFIVFQFKIEMSGNGNQMASGDTQDEEDATNKKRLAMQEESIGPLREDLADWIAKTLSNVVLHRKSGICLNFLCVNQMEKKAVNYKKCDL